MTHTVRRVGDDAVHTFKCSVCTSQYGGSVTKIRVPFTTTLRTVLRRLRQRGWSRDFVSKSMGYAYWCPDCLAAHNREMKRSSPNAQHRKH